MSDSDYINELLGGIRAISNFKPQLGQGKDVSLTEFVKAYADDPLYHWIGFDSELMYAAHRAGGAMTSLYRNLGTGCEHLVRRVIRDALRLTADQLRWEYVVGEEDVDVFPGPREPVVHPEDITEVSGAAEDTGTVRRGKAKKNSLDARIDVRDVREASAKKRVAGWLQQVRKARPKTVNWEPRGAVFEVRQGYKSMDSKRQAADIANATKALEQSRLPVLMILSNQIDPNLVKRYTNSGWTILRGAISPMPGHDDPTSSTYAFMRKVVGYDLQKFFERNRTKLRSEVHRVLETLLTPE